MKLSTHRDVEAPIARVFAELANADQWERAAMRRGADVTRVDKLAAPGPGMTIGMTWAATFRYRSKDRSANLRIDRIEAPNKLAVTATSALADAILAFDLVELSPRRTRLGLSMDVKPKTLAGRIYIQSLRLVRSRVDSNFRDRVSQFVLELEDRIRKR